MPRPILLAPLLLLGTLVTGAFGQSGMRDRYFTRYPFDRWKAEGPVSQIKWNPKTLPARLSPHQRLLTRIEFVLDGRETEKRRGRGELVIFVELTDAAGRHWRTHEAFDLKRVPEGTKAPPVLYAQDAFVVPGDYQLALAICDTQTLDHSFVNRALHVGPLRGDPLPEAWVNMPAVEYNREFQQPDVWFQPYLRGRLNLKLETRRPVHVDVVMNMTPSERVAGSVRVFRRNMSVLVPALKVLSGIAVANGSLDITLLDLTKRRVREQREAHQLDWTTMREPFANTNPGIIDVQSLATKAEMMQFFRDEVAAKLQGESGKEDSDGKKELRAVIVLSAPVFLERQSKVESSRLPKDPDRRLFYVRDRPLPPSPANFSALEGNLQPRATSMASDDIERVTRALGGRIFSVITPEEFRKALAAILSEISRM
jgi:hypothetical protein